MHKYRNEEERVDLDRRNIIVQCLTFRTADLPENDRGPYKGPDIFDSTNVLDADKPNNIREIVEMRV